MKLPAGYYFPEMLAGKLGIPIEQAKRILNQKHEKGEAELLYAAVCPKCGIGVKISESVPKGKIFCPICEIEFEAEKSWKPIYRVEDGGRFL